MYDSASGDLLLTLTNSRHLIVTFNQFVEVSRAAIMTDKVVVTLTYTANYHLHCFCYGRPMEYGRPLYFALWFLLLSYFFLFLA